MRGAANFNPEWGYLAPAPSFMRTVRIVVVAAAVGASAGAAVVFSLVDRPADVHVVESQHGARRAATSIGSGSGLRLHGSAPCGHCRLGRVAAGDRRRAGPCAHGAERNDAAKHPDQAPIGLAQSRAGERARCPWTSGATAFARCARRDRHEPATRRELAQALFGA